MVLFLSDLKDASSESIIDDIFKAWVELKEEQKTKETEEKLKEKEEMGRPLYNSSLTRSYKFYNILLF